MQAILVAEDDANLREVISWSLRVAGYRVVTAADGLEALQIMRSAPVALAVLDAQMSWVNGFEVVARMRRNPLLRRIPVVVLADPRPSAPTDVAVLPKPIAATKLVEMIRDILGEPRSGGLGGDSSGGRLPGPRDDGQP